MGCGHLAAIPTVKEVEVPIATEIYDQEIQENMVGAAKAFKILESEGRRHTSTK